MTMKKLFAILMLLPLLFAACNDGNGQSGNRSLIVGTWNITDIYFDVQGANTTLVDFIANYLDNSYIFSGLEGTSITFNEDGTLGEDGDEGNYTISGKTLTIDFGEPRVFTIKTLTDTDLVLTFDAISMIKEEIGMEVPETDISKVEMIMSGERVE